MMVFLQRIVWPLTVAAAIGGFVGAAIAPAFGAQGLEILQGAGIGALVFVVLAIAIFLWALSRTDIG